MFLYDVGIVVWVSWQGDFLGSGCVFGAATMEHVLGEALIDSTYTGNRLHGSRSFNSR
jgi:hypothetical protein